jgi:hypothetical protein
MSRIAWRRAGTWVDIGIEGLFNAGQTMTGYLLAKEGFQWPTTTAFVVAGLMGVVGVINHIRALRKQQAPEQTPAQTADPPPEWLR